jgi:hypothetical protein
MSETKMEKICTTKVQVVIKMALLHIKCYKKEILQECKKGGNGWFPKVPNLACPHL